MDKIAVLIPCYNESKTIRKVVRNFQAALPEAVIYVYDNNSTDGSDQLAKGADAVVRYEYKQGKGFVVRSMFRQIDAECYILVDGDDTYPAESAREMVNLVIEGKADMVIGDRLSSTYFQENKRHFHNMGNKMVRGLINFLFKNNVHDIMTGYRAFSYDFVKTFPVLSKGFEIETEMTIHALDKNLSIKNVVIPYRDRPDGSISKLNTYSDGMKVLTTIFKLYKDYKPLSFFGYLSLLLFLVGLILVIPVLIEYFHSGVVLRFPTLIVSGFLFLSALQSFFGGLVLDTIIQKDRQLFEKQLNMFHHFKNTDR